MRGALLRHPLLFIPVFALAVGTVAADDPAGSPPPAGTSRADESLPDRCPHGRPYTLAHRVLQMEAAGTVAETAAAGAEPGSAVDSADCARLDALLDRLAAAVSAAVPSPPAWPPAGREGALAALRSISLQLAPYESRYNLLLGRGLAEGVLDCDNRSILYYSIAQRLGLPITMVYTPRHVFVRWTYDGGWLDWETTAPPAAAVLTRLPDTGPGGARVLGPGEIPALVHAALGAWRLRRGEPVPALRETERALNLFPGEVTARFNRGIALSRLGWIEEAVAGFDSLIGDHPDYATAWQARGALLQAAGRYEQALEDLDTATRLDPTLVAARRSRIALHLARGDLRSAAEELAELKRLRAGGSH